MSPKHCVITGSNAGIGKAAAIHIASAGHHVTLACRNPDRGQAAVDDVRRQSGSDTVSLMMVDMSLQSSIRAFAEKFTASYETLDVLIHNAAEFDISKKAPTFTSEGRESILATNHLGPVLLTELLLDTLKRAGLGRIVTISSKGLLAHPRLRVNLEDPEFNHRKYSVSKAYYQSKLAQVMYTYWLSEELRSTGVTANAVRVTNVKVDLNRYTGLSRFSKWAYGLKSRFSITPQEMAKTYAYLALSDNISDTTGAYFDAPDKKVTSSKYSRDKGHIAEVMKLTNRLLGEHVHLSGLE